MRMRTVLPLAAAFALAAPVAASADFVHVVSAGESLSSVAAQDGLTVGEVAAANGLSPDAQLIAGTTLSIPPQGAASDVATTTATPTAPVSDATAAASSAGGYVVRPGDTLSGIAAANGMSVEALAATNGLDPNGVLLSGSTLSFSGSSGAPAAPVGDGTTSGGGYVVRPGDTLSGIAAANGMTVEALAAANGLDPNGVLLSGSALSFSGASGTTSASGQPIGTAALTSPTGAPYPTAETVSASQVGSIAAENGVPSSLAEAVGYQESGFNNAMTSSTGAHGVMQIEPGTWDWIQSSLAGNSLSSSSAADNVRGGVLMLRSLLQSTGGNEAEAAAGYYQGLASVQQNGMYADTQNYVNNVMALAGRFGGG